MRAMVLGNERQVNIVSIGQALLVLSNFIGIIIITVLLLPPVSARAMAHPNFPSNFIYHDVVPLSS